MCSPSAQSDWTPEGPRHPPPPLSREAPGTARRAGMVSDSRRGAKITDKISRQFRPDVAEPSPVGESPRIAHQQAEEAPGSRGKRRGAGGGGPRQPRLRPVGPGCAGGASRADSPGEVGHEIGPPGFERVPDQGSPATLAATSVLRAFWRARRPWRLVHPAVLGRFEGSHAASRSSKVLAKSLPDSRSIRHLAGTTGLAVQRSKCPNR